MLIPIASVYLCNQPLKVRFRFLTLLIFRDYYYYIILYIIYIYIYIYLRFAVLFYLSPFFFFSFLFGFLRFLSLLVFFVRINVNRDILQRQVHIFRSGSISFTFRHVATDVTELKFKNYVSRIWCIYVLEHDADVRRVIRYDKFIFIIANWRVHQSIVRFVQSLNNDESTRRSLARRDGSSRLHRIFEANDTYSKQKTNINIDFLFYRFCSVLDASEELDTSPCTSPVRDRTRILKRIFAYFSWRFSLGSFVCRYVHLIYFCCHLLSFYLVSSSCSYRAYSFRRDDTLLSCNGTTIVLIYNSELIRPVYRNNRIY